MKNLRYIATLVIFCGLFQSCLKDTAFIDVSNTKPIAEFSFGSDGTTLASFGALPDTTVLDTVIAINLASPQVLSYDVTVKVSIDPNLIAKFNLANPGNKLALIPDSAFSGPKTIDLVIPAGYRIRKIPIKLFPPKIDPSVSFVIPYSIVSAKGADGSNLLVSGNAGSILYAFIGNPIAGKYTNEWIRYNKATQTGTPAFDVFSDATFTPISPTQIKVPSGTGLTYYLNFTNTAGVLSDFKLSFNAGEVASSGLTLTSGPTLIKADYLNNSYEFNFTYNNAAGAARNITDKFTK